MNLEPVRKGQTYLREVVGHGGGVIAAKAPADGVVLPGGVFVSWAELRALMPKEGKRAVRPRR